MFMFKTLLHLVATFCTMALGLVAWLAPHLDWSRVKDESLFSSRGLVVLGMATLAIGMQMWAMLTPPARKLNRRKS